MCSTEELPCTSINLLGAHAQVAEQSGNTSKFYFLCRVYVHVQALDAVKALGDGISPEAAAAYALGFVAGTKCSGTGMQVGYPAISTSLFGTLVFSIPATPNPLPPHPHV